MATALLIAIGNPLRGDDGVAWRLALEVLRWRRTPRRRRALRLRIVQQLTPELTAELAAAERVLFVDAWLANPPLDPRPQLRPLAPSATGADGCPPDPAGFSHALDPAALLALTALLHGEAPNAWELLLPAHALEHGSRLSPQLRRQLPRARALLRRWCDASEQHLRAESPEADGAAPRFYGSAELIDA